MPILPLRQWIKLFLSFLNSGARLSHPAVHTYTAAQDRGSATYFNWFRGSRIFSWKNEWQRNHVIHFLRRSGPKAGFGHHRIRMKLYFISYVAKGRMWVYLTVFLAGSLGLMVWLQKKMAKKKTASIEIRKDWLHFIRNQGLAFSFPVSFQRYLKPCLVCGGIIYTRGHDQLTLCSTSFVVCHVNGDLGGNMCSSATFWSGGENSGKQSRPYLVLNTSSSLCLTHGTSEQTSLGRESARHHLVE